MKSTLIYTVLGILFFSVQAKAECVYPSPHDRWGWNDITKLSCDRQIEEANNSSTGRATIIRVSWGGVNGADRYEVNYSVNGSGWAAVPIVYNTENLLLTDSIDWPVGELCVRVRAGNHTDWSDFSDVACITVPDYDDGSNNGGVAGLSQPGGVRILVE